MNDIEHAQAVKEATAALLDAATEAEKVGLIVDIQIQCPDVTTVADKHCRRMFTAHVAVSRPL